MLARPMLASIFVVQGSAALRNPDRLVSQAKPVTDTLVPWAKQLAPPAVADRIPEDPKALVRLNGAVQVVGGLALATGRFPRIGALLLLGSMLPTTWAGHPFWTEDDPERRHAQRIQLLKNVTMAGGLMLAAVDTEGRPSLWWRARHGAKGARHSAKGARHGVKGAREAVKGARQGTGRAAERARHEIRRTARRARREAGQGATRLRAKLPG